ncbi:hypothetical protein SASPL_131294 [Salvia splendens]|uniref:Uncharacterized protein n=1 Tax=Salvia splendens TaxID=180675 RepID=A0A8X8X8T8_SALSN|nr:hypothetical protein SASPL_131294 [Salvia splendens]
MLVGNKVDKESERVVRKKKGSTLQGNIAASSLNILDTPSLLAEGLAGNKKNIFKQKPPESTDASSSCC